MAARAILDIEINSAAFDEFAAAFDKFQTAFKESPEQWQSFAEAMGAAAAAGVGLDEIAHAVGAIGKEMHGVTDATEGAIAGQSRLGIATDKTQGGMHKLAQTAQVISSHFASAAKWLTVGGGLAGLATGAGLFGLDGLARQVTTGRRAAGGLGLDMADTSAFRVNYAPLMDAEGVLAGVANARNDIDSQWILQNLMGGRDFSRMNNAELSMNLIDNVAKMIRDVPDMQLGAFAQMKGIDKIFSLESLRQLRREPASERDKARAGYAEDDRLFRIVEEDQLAWRAFDRKLLESGTIIDRALIRGLAPLAGPLGHLSESVANLISSFLSAPAIKDGIDGLATALDSKELRDKMAEFSRYLMNPKGFSADIRSFFVGTKDLFEDIKATFQDARVVFHELRELLQPKLDPEFNLFGLKIHPFKLDQPGTGPGIADSPAAHAWDWVKKQFGIPTSDARTESGLTFPAAGDDRVAAIRDKLAKDLGIDPAVAGGFLSAPFAESGLRGILQHDAQGNELPGGDAGWAQWHGPRRDAFMAWAKEHGLNWRSDAANLSFLEQELHTTHTGTLLRLRNARTALEGAIAGDKYEAGERHGPGDYYFNEHTANADRFARLPSPGGAAAQPAQPRPSAPALPGLLQPRTARPPLEPPPAPVPAVPQRTSAEQGALGQWGNQALTDALTRAVRAAFATSRAFGQIDVNVNNDTASRVAVSARGVAV